MYGFEILEKGNFLSIKFFISESICEDPWTALKWSEYVGFLNHRGPGHSSSERTAMLQEISSDKKEIQISKLALDVWYIW